MAFAQLTGRESLREIETCLRPFRSRLYQLGVRHAVARGTLTDANATRDYRLFADLARELIQIARPMYAGEGFGVELDQTVYALDCATIELKPLILGRFLSELRLRPPEAQGFAIASRHWPL